jgi:hypothetical protein
LQATGTVAPEVAAGSRGALAFGQFRFGDARGEYRAPAHRFATRHTDMRRSMNTLALQVQERLKRDPHVGGPFVFRARAVT